MTEIKADPRAGHTEYPPGTFLHITHSAAFGPDDGFEKKVHRLQVAFVSKDGDPKAAYVYLREGAAAVGLAAALRELAACVERDQ